MAIRMLIDASHPEETRVAVVHGNRVEDFDFESASRKQLKGNIYLAKVTRVEPSLQAAFVEYGGNRHGFLAFSEIHPDYYQIPVADRQALLAEDAQNHDDLTEFENNDSAQDESKTSDDTDSDDQDNGTHDGPAIESLESDEDLAEKVRRKPRLIKRHYKIQEVIKRRQILLVQVVKEERGNKGAALTTYLSLAGRYCVLMPNTLHGGGVSRKIANPADRKKLKSVLSELKMAESMACIIRTAGLSRTRTEIKRDFDYLTRLWEGIRDLTLRSVAPAMIYEEGDLIKRSIRDLYSRDIDEVLVDGEEGYKAAKGFMRLLMPSHARKVQLYKDRIPLFHKFQVEGQLDSMFSPEVRLRSGGYIVINPTEALVAIDVNSGKATKEHNIEETAVKTNLEAAEEVARQIRLRDMAGLVVIDFIDMEDRGNNRAVERKLKDCLKNDRARIQVGRISAFGLMEMSRQRLRPGLLEASTRVCTACNGSGMVRSIESASLHALRHIEEEGIRARSSIIHVRISPEVALYLLNKKRSEISDMERRYGFRIDVLADKTLISPAVEIDREGNGPNLDLAAEYITADGILAEADLVTEEHEDDPEDEADNKEQATDQQRSGGFASGDGDEPRRKKRRRRRRKPSGADRPADQAASEGSTEQNDEATEQTSSPEQAADQAEDGTEAPRKRRRRGRRGGRKRVRTGDQETGQENSQEGQGSSSNSHVNGDASSASDNEPGSSGGDQTNVTVPEAVAAPAAESSASEATPQPVPQTDEADAPKPRARRRRKPAAEKTDVAADAAPIEDAPPAQVSGDASAETKEAAEKPAKPARRRTRKKAEDKPEGADAPESTPVMAEAAATEKAEPVKKPARARTRTAKKPAAKKAEAASNASEERPAAKPASSPEVKSQQPAPETKAAETNPAADAAKSIHIVKDAPDEGSDKSRRKGWWQRTFGA